MTKLGDLLRQLLQEKEGTVADLAKAGGIAETTMGSILSGKIKRPPDERLRGFADFLGTSFKRLLDAIPENLREAQGALLQTEPDSGGGRAWRVRVIRAGQSGNGNYYPDAVLREAVPLFDGARVFVKSDEQHIQGRGKSLEQLIGRLSEARFIAGSGTDQGEIQARLDVLQSAGATSAKLLEAYDRGMTDLFGFSIDVTAKTKARGRLREATKFTKVDSVDLIIEPGAGGELIHLIEAINEDMSDMKLRERMIEAIRTAGNGTLPEGLDTDNDDAVEAAYREALTASEKLPAESTSGVTTEQMEARIRLVEARAQTRVLLAESGLPEPVANKLRNDFEARDSYTVEQVREAVDTEREVLARLTESGHVVGMDGGSIEHGQDRSEKIAEMLDAFFDPGNRDVRSFKECYVDITGDRRVTGHWRDCDARRLREAVGGDAHFREAISAATFGNILGDSITRRMIADYRETGQYDIWRQLVTVVPTQDFRTQERTRLGGYGDLPAVAENAAYAALTSPTDEKATYAVSKKGGLETISLETIKNDDVGVVQRIPIKLSRSGKRTLAKFVLDFLVTNPTIYDAVALFHATHNNLGSAALDATTLAAGRLAMLQQTELDSADRIGIGPRFLWVPSDLEETSVDLFRRNTNNDQTFVNSLTLEVMPVWYWTDANDWCLSADPLDIPTIEIGFLDGNEEPELFVQDNPTQGSLFSNDQITYKIRHIYGGNVLDYRGLYKAVVI